MNLEDGLGQFDTHIDSFMDIKVPLRRYKTYRKESADHQLSDDFQKKPLFFRDTRDNQEHDTKTRLSIPGPSPEKPVAEIDQLKKLTLA